MTVHAEHFEDLATQARAARLGTWVFLGSELLLFSGLFALYGGYRTAYLEAFRAGAHETDLLLGTSGTFVLLTASFLVVLAVDAVRDARVRRAGALLIVGAGLGVGFLALKSAEYVKHVRDGILPTGGPGVERAGGPEIFWTLYYAMTGLHMVHVIVGVGVLLVLGTACRTGRVDAGRGYLVENGANYWHLVDAIWLFLWPMFYLMR